MRKYLHLVHRKILHKHVWGKITAFNCISVTDSLAAWKDVSASMHLSMFVCIPVYLFSSLGCICTLRVFVRACIYDVSVLVYLCLYAHFGPVVKITACLRPSLSARLCSCICICICMLYRGVCACVYIHGSGFVHLDCLLADLWLSRSLNFIILYIGSFFPMSAFSTACEV